MFLLIKFLDFKKNSFLVVFKRRQETGQLTSAGFAGVRTVNYITRIARQVA